MPGLTADSRVVLSWLALAWERVCRQFWPAASLCGGALALLLSGLLPLLPGWPHLAALALMGLAVLAALGAGLRTWATPTTAEAVARLESTTPEGHRPLTSGRDRLAFGLDNPTSRALWRRHQAVMRARARALRVSPPRPGLAARDRRATRVLALLLLAAATAAAGPNAPQRVARALVPQFGPPAAPVLAQVWITPPEYTGRPPLMMEAGASPLGSAPREADPVTVPAGSNVLALLRGGHGQARLDLEDGAAPRALQTAGDGGQRLELPLAAETSRVRLTQRGRIVLDRPVQVLADSPPRIAWTEAPRSDGRGRLTIGYRAADDHGIETAVLEVHPDGGQRLGAAPVVNLRPGGDGTARLETHDLSSHPWAGTAVSAQLRATDAAGQEGISESVSIVLPSRRFTQPLARAVLDARRGLVTRPDQAFQTAVDLALLAKDYATGDDVSLAVYLTLQAASTRLALRDEGIALEPDLDLLWSLALAIEDGTLALTRQDLQAARGALREALDRGAPPEEIRQALDRVREAMARLMESMADSMPLTDLPMMPIPDGADLMSPQDIEALMDRMEELSDLGADEAARAMLDRLEDMLRRLESARPPTAAEQRAMAQAADLMARLREIVARQGSLLDETFRQGARRAEPRPSAPWPPEGLPPDAESLERWFREQAPLSNQSPPTPTAETRRLQVLQRDIRRSLEDLMADVGDMLDRIPEALGEADMAMREAEQALSAGDTDAAALAQGRALEALTDGQGQAMGQMLGGGTLLPMPGMRPGRPGLVPGFPRPLGGRDPFNRPGGRADDGSVTVPDEPETRRAHEILRELRRRANQSDRPVPERHYLDRLMDRF
ncbi:TIGR02302 family protein [Rhodospira trueperi]|uniref:TIGR02302 family protein n=1 Tax=Rhodospira trueperi TaxID=69960 RepID=A0A1G7DW52_9PROT|nr:TIGR02302 family protein [Rhodospira trueperi]SDE55245.1 TIGR02302 family protein [Rhodospira trueperi]